MEKLTYKEYIRLRETPFEELSEEDQERRLTDFKKRLDIGTKFVMGIFKGYIPKSIVDEFPDDDPLKNEAEIARIIVINRDNKAEA